MRKFGLAAILEFIDKGATAGMGRVGRAAMALKANLRGLQSGVGMMGSGLQSVAMASIPVGGAFAVMVKDGMKFEQSIANLKAVTLDTTGASTEALRQLAKTLGATTKFTAYQAADAMTTLARAGLSVDEIMKAIPGTLNAAAAEGIDMATAADLVASNMRAFGLSADEAGSIAGTLALVSARTNTNMLSLQEGLKFAAPAAHILGWNLKETALALGMLGDIGIKGTLGGTALRQAMVRLTKPTKETIKVFGGRDGLNKILMNTDGTIRPLSDVMMDFVSLIQKQPNVVKKAEIATKIFGVRAQSLGGAFTFTKERMEAFRAKQAELRKETGQTAETMRDIQIQTFSGQWLILRSSIEGVNIELFSLFAGFTGKGMIAASDALNDLSIALRVVRGEVIVDPKSLQLLGKMPLVMLEVASGIIQGFEAAKRTILEVIDSLGSLGRWFGSTGNKSVAETTKMITKFVILLAVIGPVTLALFIVTSLVGGLVKMFWGVAKVVISLVPLLGNLGKAFIGLRWAILGPLGVLAYLVYKCVDFGAIWEGIKSTLSEYGVIDEFWKQLKGLGDEFGNLLAAMFNVQGSAEGWREFGVAVGEVLSRLLWLITKIIEGYRELFALINEFRREGLGGVGGAISQTFGGKGFHQGAPLDKTAMATENAARLATQMADLAQRGVKTVGAGGPALTQEYATGRLLAFLKTQNLTQPQIADILTRLNATLSKIPSSATSTPVKPAVAKDALVNAGGIMGVSAGDIILNRAALASAVTSQMGGGLLGRAGGGELGGGDPGRTSPAPAAAGGGTIRIEVPLTVDGRQLAMAVAEIQLDKLERSGRVRPGDRSSMLSGRFVGGSR